MVLIDMEMPDCCEKCPFLDYEQGYCFASGKKQKDGWYDCVLYAGGNENKRHEDCPIKEFTPPEPQITTNIYDQKRNPPRMHRTDFTQQRDGRSERWLVKRKGGVRMKEYIERESALSAVDCGNLHSEDGSKMGMREPQKFD